MIWGYIMNTEKSQLQDRLKLAFIIGVIYIIFNIIGIGCPIKFFTGISCPGCGMTRAVFAALRLQFSDALYFHPLFGLVPFMFALYLFDYKLKPHHVKYIYTAICIAFLLVYIMRVSLDPNALISIDFQNSSVLKFIHKNILGG
jgi:hypothetical protein